MPRQNTAADKAAAEAAVLKLSDFPTGWTAEPKSDDPSVPTIDAQAAKCLGVTEAELNKNGPADVDSDDFSDANSHTASNSLGYTSSRAEAQHEFALWADQRVPGCLSTALAAYLDYLVKHPSNPDDSLPPGVSLGQPTVASMSFPTIGDRTVAYRVTVPIVAQSVRIPAYVDLVVAVKGRAGSEFDFESFGTPFPAHQEQHYAALVVGRLSNT